MTRCLFVLAFGLLPLGLVLVPYPGPASGCAVAPFRGTQVAIPTESAIIVWDEATKTEHFIRFASFQSTSANFGFLVPTPTKPTLAEAPQTLFTLFSRVTEPRVEYHTSTVEMDPPGGCGDSTAAFVGAAAPKASPAPDASVQVLGRARVGNLDAVSLRADTPQVLLEWLEQNGYDARPELTTWLKWYTENKWVLTAFKIATHSAIPTDTPTTAPTRVPIAKSAATTAVRMSFPTEKPYFPYREPADQRTAPEFVSRSRMLRVFLVAEERQTGTLGQAGVWPGKTVWANSVAKPVIDQLLMDTDITLTPDRSWTLTEFEDSSAPRPGTDEVYFSRSADQSTVERPPVIVWDTKYVYRERPWPTAIIAALVAVPVLGLILALILWRFLRARLTK